VTEPFPEQLEELVDGPPVIEQLDVVGSYQLFGTQREESLTPTRRRHDAGATGTCVLVHSGVVLPPINRQMDR
jgi:hypothetical protein